MPAVVYQIFNERRLELFIGATELRLDALIARLLESPPAALRSWRPSEREHVQVVEVFPTLAEARRSVEASLDRPSPWKVVSD